MTSNQKPEIKPMQPLTPELFERIIRQKIEIEKSWLLRCGSQDTGYDINLDKLGYAP